MNRTAELKETKIKLQEIVTRHERLKNVYYKGIFYVEGQKTTVKKIKSIIEALEYIC
jgi:hypothetical protein